MDHDGIADLLIDRLHRRGRTTYLGERLSTLDHMRQTAAAMDAARPGDACAVTAALLHDIGHLLDDLGADVAARQVDGRHEVVGARYLAQWFGPAVTEPVRLHVDAKRYLCAVEPRYRDDLSPASLHSLALQDGPMTERQAAAFIAQPHAGTAVQLRRCDDRGKATEDDAPALADLRPSIIAALRT